MVELSKNEIAFSEDCIIEKIHDPEKYNELIVELFVQYVNEYYGKTVVEKRIK